MNTLHSKSSKEEGFFPFIFIIPLTISESVSLASLQNSFQLLELSTALFDYLHLALDSPSQQSESRRYLHDTFKVMDQILENMKDITKELKNPQ